jgi:Helix-turn-helix domain
MGKEGPAAMKTALKTIRVIPYGRLNKRVAALMPNNVASRLRVTKKWNRFLLAHELSHLLIAFSDEVDEGFTKTFREKAAPYTKLLLLNDTPFTDRILSRLVDLQIRSSERFYLVESKSAENDERKWEELLRSFLGRLSAALESDSRRILDARIEDGVLRVVSPDFRRMEIPISKIDELSKADKKAVAHFEIDDDGSYIYWPDLVLHLGWEQLFQIVDPEAARKAQQKSHQFNERYGAAIRRVREEKGLTINEITGLSDKQLRRIERGECRLTANAAKELAKAHGMAANEYLQKLAGVLQE